MGSPEALFALPPALDAPFNVAESDAFAEFIGRPSSSSPKNLYTDFIISDPNKSVPKYLNKSVQITVTSSNFTCPTPNISVSIYTAPRNSL